MCGETDSQEILLSNFETGSYTAMYIYNFAVYTTTTTAKLSVTVKRSEKLLPQWGSSYRKPIAIQLYSWHFYHNHATKGQMCRIKETPTSPDMLKAFWKEILI